MLFPTLSTTAFLLTSLPLLASASHGTNAGGSHKNLVARQEAARAAGLEAHLKAISNDSSTHNPILRRSDGKCKNRVSATASATAVVEASSSAAAAVQSTSTWEQPAESATTTEAVASTYVNVAAAVVTSASSSSHKKSQKSSSSSAAAQSTGSGILTGLVSSLLEVTDSTCGSSDSQLSTTNTDGPNGRLSWLTCGLNDGGWTPPFVHINELIAADLNDVIATGTSPFGPCAAYIDRFYAIGSEFGIPPILIASFAMQESTCNPQTTGGGGEQGMFQISQDKCGGAPNGNCKDVNFNMRTAMKYFADTLDSNGGDVLLSLGAYNGWYKGMTYNDATRAASGNCCRCQNNLDYLHQMLNGYMQGLQGYSFGTYWNLKVCG